MCLRLCLLFHSSRLFALFFLQDIVDGITTGSANEKIEVYFCGPKIVYYLHQEIFVGDFGIFYGYFMEKLLNQKDHTLCILKLRKLESLKGYG